MTDMAERMQKRMALVEKLSALNAQQLKHTQIRSGIEVELTACIEKIGQNGETPEALTQLADINARYQAAAAACANCDQELDALTEQLNALDEP